MDFGKVPRAKLPTRFGEFTVYGFRDPESGEEAVALYERHRGTVSLVLLDLVMKTAGRA